MNTTTEQHETPTRLYIDRTADRYVRLCPVCAKARRAEGVDLRPVRRSKGMY